MSKSVVRITTSLLLTTAFLVSTVQPVTAYYDDQYGAEGAYIQPQENVEQPLEVAPRASTLGSFEPSAKYAHSTIKQRIAKYKAVNGDVTGWLTVPGTNINEPVVKTAKNANYVNRDWRGTNYPGNNWQNFKVTAAYADSRTKWAKEGQGWANSSKNIVIYGHNWTNLRTPLAVGSNNNHQMFGQLPSYTDISFAQNNPYIYYSTGENEGIWKVFCVAYCEVKESFFYNNPNPSDAEYKKLLGEWKARSLFDFDVDLRTSDRILTLSTCTRMYANMGAKQRYVVVARLLREGESENDKVTATVNKDMKKPQF